jgi:hypothetical protein
VPSQNSNSSLVVKLLSSVSDADAVHTLFETASAAPNSTWYAYADPIFQTTINAAEPNVTALHATVMALATAPNDTRPYLLLSRTLNAGGETLVKHLVQRIRSGDSPVYNLSTAESLFASRLLSALTSLKPSSPSVAVLIEELAMDSTARQELRGTVRLSR